MVREKHLRAGFLSDREPVSTYTCISARTHFVSDAVGPRVDRKGSGGLGERPGTSGCLQTDTDTQCGWG